MLQYHCVTICEYLKFLKPNHISSQSTFANPTWAVCIPLHLHHPLQYHPLIYQTHRSSSFILHASTITRTPTHLSPPLQPLSFSPISTTILHRRARQFLSLHVSSYWVSMRSASGTSCWDSGRAYTSKAMSRGEGIPIRLLLLLLALLLTLEWRW